MTSSLLRRANLFVNTIRKDPNVDFCVLVAQLCENNVFDRKTAIIWAQDRKMYYERSLVRLQTSTRLTATLSGHDELEQKINRKFLSRLREMILIFGSYLPPFEQTEGVSEELYNALVVLQKYGHLVRVVSIEEDQIILIFPNVYDMIIHRLSFGRNTDHKSRFRFWSEYKCSILSPITNVLDGNFVRRKFIFPFQLMEHEAFQTLSVEHHNAIIRNVLANFLIRYIKELTRLNKEDMIKQVISNRLFFHFNDKYQYNMKVFGEVLKKVLEEWDNCK